MTIAKNNVAVSERTTQEIVCEYLTLKKLFFFAPINENQHSAQNRKFAIINELRARKMGKKKGVSDLVVFFDSFILFLELKTSKGRLSDSQKAFLKIADGYNYVKTAVAYGTQDALKTIDEMIEQDKWQR